MTTKKYTKEETMMPLFSKKKINENPVQTSDKKIKIERDPITLLKEVLNQEQEEQLKNLEVNDKTLEEFTVSLVNIAFSDKQKELLLTPLINLNAKYTSDILSKAHLISENTSLVADVVFNDPKELLKAYAESKYNDINANVSKDFNYRLGCELTAIGLPYLMGFNQSAQEIYTQKKNCEAKIKGPYSIIKLEK